jgi:hypothetical protein
MLELDVQVKLMLRCIMAQLHITIRKGPIPIRVKLKIIIEMQLIGFVLLQDRVQVPKLMQEQILFVLELYKLFILRVAHGDALSQDSSYDTHLGVECFRKDYRISKLLIMRPMLVVWIPADMFVQEKYSSAQ